MHNERGIWGLVFWGPTGRRTRRIGLCKENLSPVMAVTDRFQKVSDTPIVNMVRRASTKAFFEPGDTRQQWKGEAAASFVLRDRQWLHATDLQRQPLVPVLTCEKPSASEET